MGIIPCPASGKYGSGRHLILQMINTCGVSLIVIDRFRVSLKNSLNPKGCF
jgi:hypothetical protein